MVETLCYWQISCVLSVNSTQLKCHFEIVKSYRPVLALFLILLFYLEVPIRSIFARRVTSSFQMHWTWEVIFVKEVQYWGFKFKNRMGVLQSKKDYLYSCDQLSPHCTNRPHNRTYVIDKKFPQAPKQNFGNESKTKDYLPLSENAFMFISLYTFLSQL